MLLSGTSLLWMIKKNYVIALSFLYVWGIQTIQKFVFFTFFKDTYSRDGPQFF
jgi:hypothetical protein